MCHLLLLLPILALPVFWLLPSSVSAPTYAAVVAVSLAVYALALKAMRKSVRTGKEGILHAAGVVVSSPEEPLSVRVRGERWSARCAESSLEPGDRISVVGIDGLTLRVIHDKDI